MRLGTLLWHPRAQDVVEYYITYITLLCRRKNSMLTDCRIIINAASYRHVMLNSESVFGFLYVMQFFFFFKRCGIIQSIQFFYTTLLYILIFDFCSHTPKLVPILYPSCVDGNDDM